MHVDKTNGVGIKQNNIFITACSHNCIRNLLKSSIGWQNCLFVLGITLKGDKAIKSTDILEVATSIKHITVKCSINDNNFAEDDGKYGSHNITTAYNCFEIIHCSGRVG